MTKKLDDMRPTLGRPPKNLRTDVDDLSTVVVKSDLDLHIVRLLALHPQLKVRFRNHNVAALDDATKRHLLADMNHVLGIKPLARSQS